MFFPIATFYVLVSIVYFILYIHYSTYVSLDVNIKAILCIVLLMVILYNIHFCFVRNTYLVHHYMKQLPLVRSVDDIYNMLKHGDVVFFKDYHSFSHSMIYHNYGISHTSIIVEENGKKYIIHAVSVKHLDKRIQVLQEYKNTVHGVFKDWKWYVLKESLLEYLFIYKSMIHVYRPPVQKPIIWKKQPNPGFCCHVIATLLHQNGLIPSSKQWFIPYFTTDELIETLKEQGYQLFRFKQI